MSYVWIVEWRDATSRRPWRPCVLEGLWTNRARARLRIRALRTRYPGELLRPRKYVRQP